MEVRDQVRGNRAWGNLDHGIMLRSVQDSVVENNVVAGNNRGFFIYDVEYAELKNNLVVDNVVGVHLSAGSTRNVVEATTSSATANRCVMWRTRRTLGRRERKPLGQLPGVGSRRQRRGRRPMKPTTWWINQLALSEHEIVAGQPCSAGIAPGASNLILRVPSVVDPCRAWFRPIKIGVSGGAFPRSITVWRFRCAA